MLTGEARAIILGMPSAEENERQGRLPPRQTLFWRVFLTNAAVLAAACLITIVVLSPGAISSGVALTELAVLAIGIPAMLVLNAVLLRRALSPLRRLTVFARSVDPLSPGPRLPAGDRSEVGELAQAFNEMLDRLVAERRESVRRALDAQEGERLRVAQDLHDEVGQTLTSVVLQVARTARRVPGEFRPELLEAQETARSSLEEVRRIALQLRPEALDDLGLASALRVFGERLGEQSALALEFRLSEALPELAHEQEIVIYRVAQEALTNVVRHADATRAVVSLALVGDRIELRVADDGRGCGDAMQGGGMRGMRERAVLIGADLDIRDGFGRGTEVILTLPPAAAA
jgi:two-component system, NarL family, sensor histidine kinase UhpB